MPGSRERGGSQPINERKLKVTSRIVSREDTAQQMELWARQHFDCSAEEALGRIQTGQIRIGTVAANHLMMLDGFRRG